MKSRLPSSIDSAAALLLQKRLQQSKSYGKHGFGGAVRVLSPNTAEKLLQDQHAIKYTEQPVPELQNPARSPSPSRELSSDSEEEPDNMVVSKIEVSADGKSVKMTKRSYDNLSKELKTSKTSISKLKDEKKELLNQVKQKDTAILELTAKLEKKRSKSKPGSRKDEQSEDVKESVKEFVKKVLFRTVKFAQPGKELKGASQAVWKGVKDTHQLDKGPKPLTEGDFVDIYDSYILSCLSDCRQYAQTRGEVAAKGTIWCNFVFGSVYFTLNNAVLTPFLFLFAQNGSMTTVICPPWRTLRRFGSSLMRQIPHKICLKRSKKIRFFLMSSALIWPILPLTSMHWPN